jgi:hypothetical protein
VEITGSLSTRQPANPSKFSSTIISRHAVRDLQGLLHEQSHTRRMNRFALQRQKRKASCLRSARAAGSTSYSGDQSLGPDRQLPRHSFREPPSSCIALHWGLHWCPEAAPTSAAPGSARAQQGVPICGHQKSWPISNTLLSPQPTRMIMSAQEEEQSSNPPPSLCLQEEVGS